MARRKWVQRTGKGSLTGTRMIIAERMVNLTSRSVSTASIKQKSEPGFGLNCCPRRGPSQLGVRSSFPKKRQIGYKSLIHDGSNVLPCGETRKIVLMMTDMAFLLSTCR